MVKQRTSEHIVEVENAIKVLKSIWDGKISPSMSGIDSFNKDVVSEARFRLLERRKLSKEISGLHRNIRERDDLIKSLGKELSERERIGNVLKELYKGLFGI